ncbi:MAG: NUDIX domain-containing protein [Phototrophicaceae bacterium]
MSFMRLGTRIAVIDDSGAILLSKRGDFGIWALPGGRVDSGELLHESAIREVREETGLEVAIERPIGLYYQKGRSRMNILYRAKPIGGQLFASSDETLDNRFFQKAQIPQELFGKIYIDHAYDQGIYLHTIESAWFDLLKLDLKLRWRWIQNLLAGRPEPKFNHFTVRAVGVVWNDEKILVDNGNLPIITSDGKRALPNALSHQLGQNLTWRWVGIQQDTARDELTFVFHADTNNLHGQWVHAAALDHHQQLYTQHSNEIWHIS